MRFAGPLIVLCAVGVLSGGCVQTAMLPAQRLDAGTTVTSVHLDEPGFLYLPRANVQVTQGLGGGDLSLNASYPFLGGGLTGRYYLGGGVNAELQLQAMRNGDAAEGPSGLALLGVQTVPASLSSWYLGAQVGALNTHELDFFNASPRRPSRRYTTAVAGGSVGYGPVDLGGAWRLQVELAVNAPLSQYAFERLPYPASRLSIGVFRLFR